MSPVFTVLAASVTLAARLHAFRLLCLALFCILVGSGVELFRAGSLLLSLPPLRQIFLGQRRSGRLGLHHDARNSPAAGFFDRLNAVDAARDLLAVAVQRVAAP